MADFSQLYGALAPNPDATYGSILPFAQNNVGSPSWVQQGANTRFAMPSAMRDAAKGYLDLANSTQTGSLTPEALQTLLFGSLGAGAGLAPRGALASGGARASIEGERLGSRVMEPGGARQFRDLNTPDNDNMSRQQWQAILDWAKSRQEEPAFQDIINKALYQNEANEQWRRSLTKPAAVPFSLAPKPDAY